MSRTLGKIMKYICDDCVSNEVLLHELLSNSSSGTCSYCESTSRNVIDSRVLLDFASDRLVESLYPFEDATSSEQIMFWEGSDEILFSSVSEIVDGLEIGHPEFSDEIATDTFSKSWSKQDLFVLDDGYLESNVYEDKWNSFINSTAHVHRFFNKEAKAFLDALFDIIHLNGAVKEDLITEVSTDQELYRARIANEPAIREAIVANPAAQLGPVPAHLASEQRMTPSGISAIYCSFERATCFSEIRAITGDLVVSGAFKTTNPLRLLDLNKISELSKSAFDPLMQDYADKIHKSAFIRNLMNLMSKPASRSGLSTYLSTQIIFEYLSIKFDHSISGLIFNSIQTGGSGTNLVLFPKYSTVASPRDNVENVSEHYMDFSHDYKVHLFHVTKAESSISDETSSPCLSFVEDSLQICQVNAVITAVRYHGVDVSIKVK